MTSIALNLDDSLADEAGRTDTTAAAALCLLWAAGSASTGAAGEPPHIGYCEGDAREASLLVESRLLARLGPLTTLRGPDDGIPATGIDRPFDHIPGAPMPDDAFFFPESPPAHP